MHWNITQPLKIMPFARTWMNLQMIILSEVNKKEKEKYHMISLKYKIHELITKQEQTHRCRELICGYQTGGLGEEWIGSLRLADANCFVYV